jgi:hypothetical protein
MLNSTKEHVDEMIEALDGAFGELRDIGEDDG